MRPFAALCFLSLAPAAVSAGPLAPSCEDAPYDVDGNFAIDPLSDGLLLLRYFFDFRGDVLIDDAVGQGCTRCTAPLIEQFIAQALAGCAVCGDAVIEAAEQCDGENLGGESCDSLGEESGTLACDNDCTFDVSGCESCGNQVIDADDEECDGNDFDGKTCLSLGFSGGVLACDSDCSFDTSACDD